MPSLPGINHQRAIKAFEKAGFRIVRQGKHITMTDGEHILTIPRANPINAYTMGTIIKGAADDEERTNILQANMELIDPQFLQMMENYATGLE